MVTALAFVPLEDLEKATLELKTFLAGDGETPSKASLVLTHFEDNYILGKVKKDGKRGKPKYDPALWNLHERVKGDLPLTTNGLEFWHSAIRSIMVESHTSVARFISGKYIVNTFIFHKLGDSDTLINFGTFQISGR